MLAREGTTPARLKRLKEVVTPPSRKITKTDLAKYLNAWDRKPDLVSLGSQKNFERFMDGLGAPEGLPPSPPFNVATYKRMIAKAILFKKAHALIRPMFPAFQGNVVSYLVAVVADRVGDRIDLEKVWISQDISPALRRQLQVWAPEINAVLHRSADGKMISEWAKKPECWNTVQLASYSSICDGIPEIR
jgi:hypothetical protein